MGIHPPWSACLTGYPCQTVDSASKNSPPCMLVVVVYTPQASTSLINLERTRQLKNAATTRSSGITDWVRNGERRIHNSMDSSSTDNSLLPMARQSSSWVMLMLSACSRSFDKVPQWESTLLRIGGRGGPQRQEGRGGTNVTNDPHHARDHTVQGFLCSSLLMLLHTSTIVVDNSIILQFIQYCITLQNTVQYDSKTRPRTKWSEFSYIEVSFLERSSCPVNS